MRKAEHSCANRTQVGIVGTVALRCLLVYRAIALLLRIDTVRGEECLDFRGRDEVLFHVHAALSRAASPRADINPVDQPRPFDGFPTPLADQCTQLRAEPP